MLCMETILNVRRLSLKQGLSQRAIAKQLQISRSTVRKYRAIETKAPFPVEMQQSDPLARPG
ncbi:putative transposase [Yersinia pekkanenii]|uniref:Transposase n=1 Tax=Yersinia pekkanenii TaxID=1288385 RepID=A0ABP1ZWL6_9GAMM|nr:putative transposase [Yersinia pekkanenii]